MTDFEKHPMTCGKCGAEVSGRKCDACGHDHVPIHERLATAEAAFRALRAAWFSTCLRSRPHEREWETNEREQLRQDWNVKMCAKFSEQTERILAGEYFDIAPSCAADLDAPQPKEARP